MASLPLVGSGARSTACSWQSLCAGFSLKDQRPAENPDLFQVLGESARFSRPAWQLRGEARSGWPWALGCSLEINPDTQIPAPGSSRGGRSLFLIGSQTSPVTQRRKRLGHTAPVCAWQHTSTSDQRCFQHQMVENPYMSCACPLGSGAALTCSPDSFSVQETKP